MAGTEEEEGERDMGGEKNGEHTLSPKDVVGHRDGDDGQGGHDLHC